MAKQCNLKPGLSTIESTNYPLEYKTKYEPDDKKINEKQNYNTEKITPIVTQQCNLSEISRTLENINNSLGNINNRLDKIPGQNQNINMDQINKLLIDLNQKMSYLQTLSQLPQQIAQQLS